MDSPSEFHRVASEVRNWGRWGESDGLGTLHLVDGDTVRHAAALARRGKVFPLGIEFGSSSPQGGLDFRQKSVHLMTVDGGDETRYADYGRKWAENGVAQQISGLLGAIPIRFNDDVIIMLLQAAIQWDALSHARRPAVTIVRGGPGRRYLVLMASPRGTTRSWTSGLRRGPAGVPSHDSPLGTSSELLPARIHRAKGR